MLDNNSSVNLSPLCDEISSNSHKNFEGKTVNNLFQAKVESEWFVGAFIVHSDFDDSIVREAIDVDMAILDVGFIELFYEQVDKDNKNLMTSHGVDMSKFSVDALTVQVDEDLIALQGEAEFKFSIDSLPVEHFKFEFETPVNSLTKVDELNVINVNVDKSFELIILFEEPQVITYNNVIDLDKETLEK